MASRWLCIIVVAILLFGCIPAEEDDPTQPPADDDPITDPVDGETALVVDVIDGDTIDVRLGGDTYRVRYIGVNTPERDEPCYFEATAANAVLVEGQTVTLVRDVSETDRYGRLLRYVYAGPVFVNAELVAQGYAEASVLSAGYRLPGLSGQPGGSGPAGAGRLLSDRRV